MQLLFGACVLNVGARSLAKDGTPQHLSKKAFDLLHCLVDERPRVVSKRELMERLWPETFVSEANLAVLVREIRVAIGDVARGSTLIRTHSGVGYSFVGQVTESARSNRLESGGIVPVLTIGPRRLILPEGTATIGRDPCSDVHVAHPSVSRLHARIFIDGRNARIEDVNSRNGLKVDGRAVTVPTALANGVTIRLGSIDAIFTFEESGQGSTWSVGE